MNTRIQTIPAATIQINETFLRLLNGAATVSDIIAERNAARATLLAREDAIMRCRREWNEARDFFFRSCTY